MVKKLISEGGKFMAKKENRVRTQLKCPNCGFEIRPTEKNKKNTTERLELNKYWPKCRKTVTVKEKK